MRYIVYDFLCIVAVYTAFTCMASKALGISARFRLRNLTSPSTETSTNTDTPDTDTPGTHVWDQRH